MPPDTTERGLTNDLICIKQTGKSMSENCVLLKEKSISKENSPNN